MENITQGIIGGWIMEKVVGEEPHQTGWRQRNKALILGGLITNIPDLDIFIGNYLPHQNYMSEFLFHRGIMHSVFFNIPVALLVGWLCARSDRYKRPWRRRALASYLSILFGHIFIDGMTSYGTRFLTPFTDATFSWNNIFVVDLFYTIPLIVIRFTYIFLRKKSVRKIWYRIGAAWMLIYPAFTIAAKQAANHAFDQSLQNQGVSYTRMMSSPEPLQTFLWRGVVQVGQGYYEGYYSIFDSNTNITWHYIPNSTLIRKEMINYPDVKKVEKRAQGRTSYSSAGSGTILINAVKNGGILGRQRPSQGVGGYSTFIATASGNVIGQGGQGRFLEGSFSNIWNEHRERVWGKK